MFKNRYYLVVYYDSVCSARATHTEKRRIFMKYFINSNLRSAALMLAAFCVPASLYGAPNQITASTPTAIPIVNSDGNGESVPVELYPGVILHVPNAVLGIKKEKTLAPVKADSISLVFEYPDMTLTDWPGPVMKSLQILDNKYVPTPDRFPVLVERVFFSPGEEGNAERRTLPDSRPPRIEYNVHCRPFAGYDKTCTSVMAPTISAVPGVDELIWKEWVKMHPGEIHNPSEGGIYINKPDAAYELWMDCGSFKAPDCTAYVFVKASHLQYKMDFTSEAIFHISDLIIKFNSLLNSWFVE